MPHTRLVALIDFNHDRKTLAARRLSRLWLLSSTRHPALGCHPCEASLVTDPADAIQLFPSNCAFPPYICDTTWGPLFFLVLGLFLLSFIPSEGGGDASPFREMAFSLVIYTF